MRWKTLNGHPFHGVDLLTTLITEVGILTLQHISLYYRLQTLHDSFFVLDGQRDHKEGFLTFRFMLAFIFPYDFIHHETSKVILHERLRSTILEVLLQSIHEEVEEFIHIHLLEDVGGLSLEVLEGVAELLRNEVLLLGVLQGRHHALQLVEHVLLEWYLKGSIFGG